MIDGENRTEQSTDRSADHGADQATGQASDHGAAMLAQAWQQLRGQDSELRRLARAFTAAGRELYLVGGSVRDAMLGRLSHDLDFTTDAKPADVVALLTPMAETVWDTGIEYGTVSALVNGLEVEITTFRADQYDGESRNPEVTFGDTLEGDLVRRDFRCNAMALKLSEDGEHEFCDPLDGLSDLAAHVLDTPDAPEISFRDDPLRMLRACRFVSQLGFTVAPRVRDAMTAMNGEIKRITVERVAVELNKLILGEAPDQGLDLMVESGLADHVLPELPALKLTQDEHQQHKDVYLHSLTVLRNATEQEKNYGVEPNLELRWAALMHDIGKPATRAFSENGAVSFHHHEVVGAKMVRKRLRQLKYSKQHVKDISQLVFLHMRFYGYGDSSWTDSAVRRYVTDAGELLPLLHMLVRADCTTRNKRKSERLRRNYDDLENRIAELQEKEDLEAVRPDLDGNEIMQILQLKPGPEVGQAWAFMKELRLDRGPLERDEAIQALRGWWENRDEQAEERG